MWTGLLVVCTAMPCYRLTQFSGALLYQYYHYSAVLLAFNVLTK